MQNSDTPFEPPDPLHMDKWSRNQRLYQQLLNMGLFCNPIFNSDGEIEALYVASDLPTDMTGIGMPVKRTQVGNVITPAGGDRANVIDFPTVL